MDNPETQKTMSAMEALEMIYSSNVELNARLSEALDAMAAHRDIMISEINSLKRDIGELRRIVEIVTTGEGGREKALPVASSESQVKPSDFKWDKRPPQETPEDIFQKMQIRIPNR